MFYYYATTLENMINFEREATTEEFNLLEPHISKVSKMLVDKRRIPKTLQRPEASTVPDF